MMPAIDRPMSTFNWNRTRQVSDINTTTTAYNTMGWYVNTTLPDLVANETILSLVGNETTPVSVDFNQTTQDWYFNQTKSTYDVATDSIPISSITFTLFSLACCLTLFGLVGNCFTLISMFKFKERSKGHGKLVTALAICDSVATGLIALEQPVFHDVFGFDIRANSTIGCKLFWAILFSAMGCSSGVVVLISIERFLAVWFPLESRMFLTDKNILRAVSVCVTSIVIIYVTMPVLYAEIKDTVCHPNLAGTQYSTVLMEQPNTAVFNVINGFVVILFMLLLFIFTTLTMIKRYK